MTNLSQPDLEFLKAIESWQEPKIDQEYRAYYDEDGIVTGFAGSGFPKDGNWIPISREIYITHDWQYYKVKDGKLIKEIPNFNHMFALTSSDKGYKVVKNHAGILLESGEEYPNVEYYERRNC